MRNINVTALLCAAIAWLMACNDGQDMSDFPRQIQNVQSVEALAKDLAADHSWLTPEVVSILELRAVKLSEIPSIKSSVASRLEKISFNGVDYEVIVERQPVKGQRLSKTLDASSAYRVAMDPDRYYFPTDIEEEDIAELPPITFPTYYYDGSLSNPVEEDITLDIHTVLSEPLFLVTMREIIDDPNSLGKGMANPGIYFAFASLTLRKKCDESAEEFEMFFSDGGSETLDPFRSTSTWNFDGNQKPDAAGVNFRFPDVNTLDIYTRDSIALRRIDGAGAPLAWRIVAIEDDNVGIKHMRIDYNQPPGNTINYKEITYYDMADNLIKANVTTKFNLWGYSTSNDDRYTASGVKNINLTNLDAQLHGNTYLDTDNNDSGVGLADINWRFRKLTY